MIRQGGTRRGIGENEINHAYKAHAAAIHLASFLHIRYISDVSASFAVLI